MTKAEAKALQNALECNGYSAWASPDDKHDENPDWSNWGITIDDDSMHETSTVLNVVRCKYPEPVYQDCKLVLQLLKLGVLKGA